MGISHVAKAAYIIARGLMRLRASIFVSSSVRYANLTALVWDRVLNYILK